MEQKENNNLETSILSEQEKKFAIYGVVFSTALILTLIIFIVEAYINQHPVFEFLQYAAFKPGMEILGSISLLLIYTFLLIYSTTLILFALYDFQWNNIVQTFIIAEICLIIVSFLILFISSNWQLQHLVYKHMGFFAMACNIIGQMLQKSINKSCKTTIPWFFVKLSKFPFYTLGLIGIVSYIIYFSFIEI